MAIQRFLFLFLFFSTRLSLFLESKVDQVNGNAYPVQTVANNGAIGSSVVPAKNSVENLISTISRGIYIRVSPTVGKKKA
jgi:hypothetical protein